MNNTIYILKNKINSKVYIGQTWKTLVERAHGGSGYKPCIHLHKAISLYGWDQFYYEILAVCSSQMIADYLEKRYIKAYNSTNRKYGYNIRYGGNRGRHSDESKKKMSVSSIGKNKGNTFRKGAKLTEETKIKISNGTKGKNLGNKNRLGKKSLNKRSVSKETRQRLSMALKGKPWSEKRRKAHKP